MDHTRYLDLIRADSDRLLGMAQRNPDAMVSTCPGWTSLDIVRHVGEVYKHKILCMELGRQPESGERGSRPDADADLVLWFVSLRDRLIDQLVARGPEQRSHTWFPPDQTVGFWYRRMAHETAVHRVDAELTCGQESPVDPELAADGVDEVLGFLTHDFGDRAEQSRGVDRTVAVGCGGRRWAVTLRKNRVEWAARGAVPDARIDGEPGDLLLHLWGRRPADSGSLTSSGDATALAAFRDRLRAETS
ncbi:maleylpyruvate isomerase family mycothiol-dependent enzyme [Streptosporangium sp. NPDC051022]|uniref:maleylpyruvate isomerase family mycothiol-dependent enzyme n=1 Tax=Streptosporangium sp. NPDC051022 TaxID=3155752 RepID=UPI003441A0D7